MSEPPIETSTDGIQPHAPKTGHRLVDFTIAGSAILISLISLWVGIHHGHVQERLVAANSWPFLTFETSGAPTPQGQVAAIQIQNDGVGPAILKSLLVQYQGKTVHGFIELLQMCCGLQRDFKMEQFASLGVAGESHPVGVIRGREKAFLLALARSAGNAALWDRFAASHQDLTFDACYCSIIGDCWKSDLRSLEPLPVASCKAGPDNYREFGAGLDDLRAWPVIPR